MIFAAFVRGYYSHHRVTLGRQVLLPLRQGRHVCCLRDHLYAYSRPSGLARDALNVPQAFVYQS